MHPTVKPVAMVADALKDTSRPGGLVLDAFCGSGTILIAAQKTGRRARAIEIDPLYCDMAIRRWQTFAKDDAILAETGETFDEVASRRLRRSGRGRTARKGNGAGAFANHPAEAIAAPHARGTSRAARGRKARQMIANRRKTARSEKVPSLHGRLRQAADPQPVQAGRSGNPKGKKRGKRA